LNQLIAKQHAYPCACSRKDIETALHTLGIAKPRHAELIYPGTCRTGLNGRNGRAWRLRTPDYANIHWHDRRLGSQQQEVHRAVGDFVLQRADGLFAYQLAVVVDDAAQGITHVVRGEDLADNTARQIVLQQMLGLDHPTYMHTPLVRGANGEKLSKQNGATPLNTATPAAALDALLQAAQVLGLSAPEKRDNSNPIAHALEHWVAQWQKIYPAHDH
jgi:glutamyl-Q tRNA(Asp) synthetase